MATHYFDRVSNRWPLALCVGLDPDKDKIPAGLDPLIFLKGIIRVTHPYAAVFKLNLAFYLAFGFTKGGRLLYRTIEYIRQVAPNVPVILDGKFGDVPTTSKQQATFAYNCYGVDAVTVNPYLGLDAIRPFFRIGKGVYVLARTSNPGAAQTQDICLADDRQYFDYIATLFTTNLKKEERHGFVVGATVPEQLAQVRRTVGNTPLLIPGVGKQGGDLAAAVTAAKSDMGAGFVINVSGGITYAYNENDDGSRQAWEKNYAALAEQEAHRLTLEIGQLVK